MTGSSNSCVFSFICSVIRCVDIRVCECTLVICSVQKLYKLAGSLFVYACLQKSHSENKHIPKMEYVLSVGCLAVKSAVVNVETSRTAQRRKVAPKVILVFGFCPCFLSP
jgi:hypothetical protein